MTQQELSMMKGSISISIKEILARIDKNAKKILYIVDDEDRLLGSVSDGDVRRWLLQNGSLEDTAEEVLNRRVARLIFTERSKAAELMKQRDIYSVPIIDQSGKLIDVISFNDEEIGITLPVRDELKDVPVVIMAGGKGTRLYPYTKILPKPLIPIGDVPILERIFQNFYDYGVNKFYLTINYKKEMIRSYFNEINPPYQIEYFEEELPLGTAGGISLIKEKFVEPVIVTNCDILIETDYSEVIRFHKESGNDLTIVSSLKNISVPYGVLHSREQGLIMSMEEKPELSYFINTGMYIVNPEYLKWIPEGKRYHMTELANDMIVKGKRVGMYPISEGSFLDMGQFEEMKRMEKIIEQK